jgi:hypothetical protein
MKFQQTHSVMLTKSVQSAELRAMHDFSIWFRCFWPIILITVLGVGLFGKAIVASVVSTPHPELVYVIGGVFVLCLLLSGTALKSYLSEVDLLQRIDREGFDVRAVTWEKSAFSKVYAGHAVGLDAEEVEDELHHVSLKLQGRLALPGYLGGALVGIGLVGTFVGLLATLEELGGVFAALSTMGGPSSDSASMFSNLVTQLQAPMKGMGTAFVASLYGVLGSLLVGLNIQSVRSVAEATVSHVRSYALRNVTKNEKPSSQMPEATLLEFFREDLQKSDSTSQDLTRALLALKEASQQQCDFSRQKWERLETMLLPVLTAQTTTLPKHEVLMPQAELAHTMRAAALRQTEISQRLLERHEELIKQFSKFGAIVQANEQNRSQMHSTVIALEAVVKQQGQVVDRVLDQHGEILRRLGGLQTLLAAQLEESRRRNGTA